jgi:hypothetical protein
VKEISSTPGARESNAGDDFHNLWACQQTLPLLQPQSGLTLVKVEELAREDLAAAGDSKEDWFLAADLTEYYGGRNFATARRVVISQLKHSTRHAALQWTVGRLAARYKSGKTLVGELARMLTGFRQQASCAEIAEKLRIRLVSNQPLAAALRQLLTAIRQALVNGVSDLKSLRASLNDGDAFDLDRLHAASALSEADFILFLHVLDLSACGATDRSWLRAQLRQKIGESVVQSAHGFNNLYQIIRHEISPEGRNSRGIDRNTVVACLGATEYDDLFPVPPRFVAVPDPIPTLEVDALLRSVTDPVIRRLIVHGDAGVGKTTTLQRVMERLPPSSIGILYDCYGGGSYMDAGGQRHTHRRALVELINELAIPTGLPLTVIPPDNIPDLERLLANRIHAAAELAAKSGALLVIAIDAADNAIVAANGDPDCFVSGLWRHALPRNARLVMSARSHRRQHLGAPADTLEFPLTGFDAAASSTALRRRHAAATDSEAAQFHIRSRGNPRIQFYSISQAETLAQAISEAGTTPDDLFAELLGQADVVAAPGISPRHSLAVLLQLTRPVPFAVFAEICGQPLAWAASYCEALAPGALVDEGHVTFRDEDFETYLRQQISAEQRLAAEQAIATVFQTHSATNPYAARTLAEHLFRAGHHAVLESIALDLAAPLPITDQLERVVLQQGRIAWALKAAGRKGDDASGARLLIAAGELARTDGALTALVRRNPGLAARFGDPDHVRRLILRERHRSWQGPAHWRLALLYARNSGTRQQAEEHAGLADAWLRRRQAAPPEERHGWDIKPDDLANAIAVVYWTKGVVPAAKYLRRWHPIKFRLDAALALAEHLAPELTPAELDTALQLSEAPPLVAAAFLEAAGRAGRSPSTASMRKVLDRLVTKRALIPKYLDLVQPSLLGFLELAAGRPGIGRRARRLLKELPWKARGWPTDHISVRDHDQWFRAWALRRALIGRAANAIEVLPANFTGRNAKRYQDQRAKVDAAITQVLGSYNLRARVLAGRSGRQAVRKTVSDYIAGVRKKTEETYEKNDWYFRDNARRYAEAVLAWPASAGSIITALGDLAEKVLSQAAPDLWLDLARLTLRQPATTGLGWELLERAATFWESSPFAASDRWPNLLKCAEAAERLDPAQAQGYYRRALKSAEGIDDDNIHLLALHARLAGASAGSPGAAGNAPRLAHTVEYHRDLVSDGDNLPWAATVEAATALSLPEGLALASRWDDQHDLRIADSIVSIIDGALTGAALPPLAGIHLSAFAGTDHSLSRSLKCLEILHQMGSGHMAHLHRGISLVSLRIRRDFQPHERSRAADEFLTWARARRLESAPGVPELAQLATFLSQLPAPTQSNGSEPRLHPTRRRPRRLPMPKTIAQALRQIRSTWKNTRESDAVLAVVARARHIASPRDRLELLAGLGTLDFGFYGASIEIQAISSLLDHWRQDDAIIAWFRRDASAIAARLLRPAPRGGSPNSAGLALYCRLVREHLGSGMAVLGEFLSAELPRLGAAENYRLVGILADGLAPTASAQILDWSLSRLEPRLPPRNSTPVLNLEPVPALAQFFFALMGHPELATRWTTLHITRGLTRDLPELLAALVAHTKTQSVGPFRAPQYEFFWMSARVSLLQLLLRLAHDEPVRMKKHAIEISHHALGSFPHALMRALARATCLHLAGQFRRLFTPKILRDLKAANSPRRRVRPKPRAGGQPHRDKWADLTAATRFHFNPIDTVPYWFDPAARLWGLTSIDFARAADRWICDEWHRSELDWKDDRREMREKFSWTRTHNDHGRIPEVELTHHYLEYHAMMCAAGELVVSRPLIFEPYTDSPRDYCPWRNWLGRWIGDHPELWYADWRTTAPLRNAYWDESVPSEKWYTAINDADFDDVLGLNVASRSGQLIVDGTSHFAARGRRETVYVSSALVSPKPAPALLRAFQIIDEPSDYGLPHEAGSIDQRNVNVPGFQLHPWIFDRSTDRGTQDHDPASKHLSTYFHRPTEPFIRYFKMTATTPIAWVDRDGKLVLEEEIWDDGVSDDAHYDPVSSGRLVWCSLEHIRPFLRAAGRNLLLKVTIERRHGCDQQKNTDKKHECRKARLYLYTAEGRLLTVDSSRQIG